MNVSPGLRGALARALLLVLAAAQVASFPFRELPVWLSLFADSLSSSRKGPADDVTFWFDPGYAPFLRAVRRSTPEDATVALVAPKKLPLYLYRAAYELVPRRVVDESRTAEAQFVAVYREAAAPGLPPGSPIPGGTLVRR